MEEGVRSTDKGTIVHDLVGGSIVLERSGFVGKLLESSVGDMLEGLGWKGWGGRVVEGMVGMQGVVY